MHMRFWPSGRIALSILAFGLALGLLLELNGGYLHWGDTISEVHRGAATKIGPASVLPDFGMSAEAASYSDLVDRPLFSPTRMQAPTQIVTAAPEPAKPSIRRGLYQLMGVTDLGPNKIAYLREVATNRVRSVREGDSLQELTVKAITANQITLAYAGDVESIDLAKFTPSGRVPLPTPTAPTAQALAPPQVPPNPTVIAATTPNATIPPSESTGSLAASNLVPPPAARLPDSREQAALRRDAERAWGGKM